MFRISVFFRSHGFRYSTIVNGTSANHKPHLIISFLIDSLRFSEQDAISLTSKGNLTHLKSTANSNLVLNTFKNYGLNLVQIREIISSFPKILTCKANKTLEPKIRVFKELGLSGSDLVVLIKRNPKIFEFGLHTRIIPSVDLLKRLLTDDENVVKFINRSKWLFFSGALNRLSTNVSLLQNLGLSDERITKFMLFNPTQIMTDPNRFENRVNYVEKDLGISPGLHNNFIYALYVVLFVTDLEIEKKKQVFRSFGWSDSDIVSLFRIQPYCLKNSEGKIRQRLDFYMKGLGYTPLYLMSCTNFFTLSMEKRVIPRYKMLEILKEKRLVKDKPALTTIVSYSEVKFLEFLKGFEKDIPGCCEIYMDSVKSIS